MQQLNISLSVSSLFILISITNYKFIYNNVYYFFLVILHKYIGPIVHDKSYDKSVLLLFY